jgi:hypothetical protein
VIKLSFILAAELGMKNIDLLVKENLEDSI